MKRWMVVVFWLALLAYPFLVLLWLSQDRRVSEDWLDSFSTFNTSDEGLSLALAYARELRPGVPAGILTRSLDEKEISPDTVVLRVHPTAIPAAPFLAEHMDDEEKAARKKFKGRSPLLTAAEESWVYRGGRLVLALDERYGSVGTQEARGDYKKVFPLWPGVTALRPPSGRALSASSELGHAIFLIGDQPVVTRSLLGRGEIIFLACPEIFQNAALNKVDHLALLGALIERRPVLFDEAVHGVRNDAGILELFRRWKLGPFLLLLLIVFCARFWRNVIRLGPAVEDFEDRRSEAVDVVESLAALYDRGLTREEALQLYEDSFRSAVAARTRLRGDALEQKVLALSPSADHTLHASRSMSAREFGRALERINEGFRRLHIARH